jgi:hypothetical protein
MAASRTPLIAVVLATLLATASSLNAAEPPAGPVLCGMWSGYWQSCTTGHRGPLHASFTPTDGSHYRVVFTGRSSS